MRKTIKTKNTHNNNGKGTISKNMVNERITEDYVRGHFKQDGMFKSIKLEEQRSRNKVIKDLLKNASKRSTGNIGSPEFIITFPSIMDLVIIVECKPELKSHKSDKLDAPEKYAVDGVLHYAKFLNEHFNTIAIAVSGENKEHLAISNFFIKKGSSSHQELSNKELLSVYDYLGLVEERENAERLKDENILLFASELNEQLYNYSVPESERATIVSGILIALQNKTFRDSYHTEDKPSDLVEDLLKAIERVLKARKMGDKIKVLMGEYKKISQSNKLAISDKIRNEETGEEEKNTLLRDLIFRLKTKVFPFTQYKHIGYDILGQFYSEFIRYANGDKKLGLVLTPQHVTEFFVDIANLSKDDIIYDNCCGTAGFLIKGMKRLIELAGEDNDKIDKIKREQIVGVEERSDMFTYACSNMMMRGDGKSNIYMGDSLSQTTKNKVTKHKPTIGFLNPPYSTSISELEFVYQNLECLEKNGTCIAIIPMSCMSADSGLDYEWKKKLLQKHTLEAVFSMPVELFYPTGTVTVITVFKAHVPHQEDYETYFGYCRDDGFIKVKNLGRVDFNHKWEDIKKLWLYNYKNKKEVESHSIKKNVSPENDWCAENFLETDYSNLSKEEFEEEVKKYFMFKSMN